MGPRQSPRGEGGAGLAEGCTEHMSGMGGECEAVCSGSAFEQWDSYWEDLTRYAHAHTHTYPSLRLNAKMIIIIIIIILKNESFLGQSVYVLCCGEPHVASVR